MRAILLSLLVVVAAGACTNPDEQVAQRIRDSRSELIQEVIYRPQNILDPPEILVHLRPGVTEAQAEALWCDVVVPAGGSVFADPVAVTLWADGGNGPMMAADATCPTPAPS